MTPKTHLLTEWDTDPARLVDWANRKRGMKLKPLYPLYELDSISSFQVVPSPATEGEGYYIFVLYNVVYTG